jgi:XTP/dITP diphosphohydrolase
VEEIGPLLTGAGVEVVPVGGLVGGWHVEETGETLAENAALKARAAASATGLPAVADDTGLFVDALGGQPGVRSARYAGEPADDARNRAKLLSAMDGRGERAARFRTVALVRWPDGRELSVEGVCEGNIIDAERGDGGFGYDSLFVPVEGDGRTFAEMAPAEKHAMSHRGRAFRALVDELRVTSP